MTGESLVVQSGGAATNAALAGGYLAVSSGGYAISTTVLSGGSGFVASGGTAFSTVIAGGGILTVQAGGTVLGATLSGGTLELGGADTNSSTAITLVGLGNDLQFDSGELTQNVVSGFVDGDKIAFNGKYSFKSGNFLRVVYTPVTSAIYAAGGTNTGSLTLYNEGTAICSLSLAGNYAGAVFHVTSDTAGGYDIGLTATPSDFNNDGSSDLLLENNNGATVLYTMSGLAVSGTAYIGNAGPTWHVMGSADFNGDGQNDILLQKDNSVLVEYIMRGTTVTGAYSLGTPARAGTTVAPATSTATAIRTCCSRTTTARWSSWTPTAPTWWAPPRLAACPPAGRWRAWPISTATGSRTPWCRLPTTPW